MEGPGTFADIQSVKSYLYKAVRNAALQFCEHKEVKERYREYVLAGNATEQDSDPHRQLEYEELQGLFVILLSKITRAGWAPDI